MNSNEQDILYISPSGFKYKYLLPFELKSVKSGYRDVNISWMKQNWHFSFIIAFVYLALIVCLKSFMKNRKGYKLRTILIVWNAGLAIFSILGALRNLPEFIYILTEKGLEYSTCVETNSYGVTGYWALWFILSKAFELFDTVLLILRKRELIFLHWYHHLTVLMYVWYFMAEFPSNSRWFSTINYSIHAIMYTYYTIIVLKVVHIPKIISMFVTSLQIIQMVIGVYINYKTYQFKIMGKSCGVSYWNIYMTYFMYASYFYLFLKFFLDKYMKKKHSSTCDKKIE